MKNMVKDKAYYERQAEKFLGLEESAAKMKQENDFPNDLYSMRATEEFNSGRLIAAEGCSYSLDDMETRLNNNVLIVGGAGTGKTRHIVTPNIRQAVGSYFICDPKGLLYRKYSGYLKERGYSVKIIDFPHPERSDGYNPTDYLRTTQDITKLAATIVDAKESEGTTCDPFWDRMTVMLLSAIIVYLKETGQPNITFSDILGLVRLGERFNDDDKKSSLSRMFSSHIKMNKTSWACELYENVNAAPNKTYDSIRCTLAAKFSQLDTEELRAMMSKGGFDFAQVAREKTAVFVTVSDTDRSMDTLVNIFFSQAMNELCSFADERCDEGRLPIPVRFVLDDFATNCRIEEFPRMISSIRSRGISVMLMIQAESQLTQGYGFDAQTIISNCDTYVYLGGNDARTAEAVSECCDHPLREVLYMPVGHCWVFRRGSEPIRARLAESGICVKEKA